MFVKLFENTDLSHGSRWNALILLLELNPFNSYYLASISHPGLVDHAVSSLAFFAYILVLVHHFKLNIKNLIGTYIPQYLTVANIDFFNIIFLSAYNKNQVTNRYFCLKSYKRYLFSITYVYSVSICFYDKYNWQHVVDHSFQSR